MDARDWCYQRLYDVYGGVLLDTDSSPSTLYFTRRQAYARYWEYWILHRSKWASGKPVVAFEQRFSHILRLEVLPFVDGDDPLGIRNSYKDGRLTTPVPVWSLKQEDIATWVAYQSIVG